METFKNFFIKLKRTQKQILAIIFDVFLSLLCLYLALIIRLEKITFDINLYIPEFFFVMLFLPFFIWKEQYKSIFRYFSIKSINDIFIATLLYSILISLIFIYGNFDYMPRSIGILQSIFFFIFIVISRSLINFFFKNSIKDNLKTNVLIYGAGNEGFFALNLLRDFNVIGYIDEDVSKIGRNISNLRIYSPNKISELISKYNIKLILVTINYINLSEKNQLIQRLSKYNIKLSFLPDPNEILSGKINISDFKNINLDELIERNIIVEQSNVSKIILNKSIVVTGSGGSIGSEIVRQLILYFPKEIILIDNSEYNLYKMNLELDSTFQRFKEKIKITPYLISVNNTDFLNFIFDKHKPHIVYHAAAYKHVPLGEINPIPYIETNILGTVNLVKISIKYNVENFIYISTDKAVRPKNIMGASKRFSEIYLQSFYNYFANKNINVTFSFSIVRFGNVIGSNGSVIPLFLNQISQGGPVTVTHPEVTRFFMTIQEAVSLVLNTLTLTKKCEIFVLDMGKSVKIIDLARKLIKLSGHEVKENNNNGDIEISITGLRDGEKLYEELLIGDNPTKSTNDNIYVAKDSHEDFDIVETSLKDLELSVKKFDIPKIKQILSRLVEGYVYIK